MADTPISSLPSASSVGGTDVVPIVQGGQTKKAAATLFVGATGPQGPQGATGATGATGAQGPAGSDATVTDAAVATQVSSGANTQAALKAAIDAEGQAQGWGSGGGGTVSDATASAKGVVQLAGDMGGTAAAPTVTGGTHHGHTTSQLTDATTVGKAVLTAADAPTARSALGAGTSSLALGTSSSTAKRGDYAPAATDISDASAVGRSVLTAADAATARTAIGAGTSSFALPTQTGNAGKFLTTDGTSPSWGTPAGGGSGSGLPSTVVNKTAAYTAAAGDFVQADVTSAGFTVTLPAAPAVGALVAVKKVDASANTLTIVPAGTGNIDGDPTATTTTKMAGAIFEHVGSDAWRIVASMTTTGPAGPTGASGPAGPAASVTVGTTTTLPAGSSAVVTNSGTSAAAVFNFAIPQGIQGSSSSLLPQFRSGEWSTLLPGAAGPSGSKQFSNANGQLVALPFLLANPVTFNGVAAHVWSSGVPSATLRVGFYADNNGIPGSLIADLGALLALSAGGPVTAPISQALSAGKLWCVWVQQGGASQAQTYGGGMVSILGDSSTSPLYAASGNPAAYQSSATTFTGALPSTFPALSASTIGGDSVARLVFKAA
jgi:hypothetical protein